jgi:hypothetical protein
VTERTGLAFWTGSVRPLSIARPLAAVTRFALPPEVGQPSIELLRYVQAIAEDVRVLVRERLQRATARADLPAFLSALRTINKRVTAAYEDQLARQRRADLQFGRQMAEVECRKGCAFCCHLNVTATALEAMHIAAILRMGGRADLERSVSAASEVLSGLDPGSRLARKSPCPLLVQGACSIYQARPIACRTLLSLSARACERHFNADNKTAEPTPSLVTPRVIGSAFLTGEIAALQDLGLAGHLVELTAAVALLLRDPTALARWLGGEDVFAPA